jgi:Transglycosylase SLT domain
MSEPIAPRPVDACVTAAIRRAADATGVDFSLLVETARRESAMNPNARAGSSSATGLFQFIDSTWLDMVRRHGAAHGLGRQAALLQSGEADAAERRDILALRADPELSARLAGELARENAAALTARLGRAPSAGELYAAHVMGAGGAARLIEAAQQGDGNAAALFPREAGANRGLFFSASGEARSAQDLLDRLGVEAGAAISEPAVPAAPSGPLSPALAHALFAMALLPLLRAEPEPSHDPLRALAAYGRLGKL